SRFARMQRTREIRTGCELDPNHHFSRYRTYADRDSLIQRVPSTYHGYRNLWNCYLQQHGQIALRHFRTADAERILERIAQASDLTSTTLQHTKAFLSGVFRYGKRQGVIHSENPVRDAVLPKARAAEDTYAYSVEEINQMLNILPKPAATMVSAAS